MNFRARTLVSLAVGAMGIAAGAHAQDVKCEKYALPNGMTVILHEDHSLPSVTINTWYRVGAQDEPPGRSGFAPPLRAPDVHGHRPRAGEPVDVIMETGGGSNTPRRPAPDQLLLSRPRRAPPHTPLAWTPTASRTMGNTMTQEKLDKQRDVVRNELRQTIENAPYGKAGEMVYKLMYEPTHPYYYGVIGTHQDLEAANVTNVKDFFATFYVPNNASLVVAGDFDPNEIKPLVANLFGTIARGPDITRKYERPKDPIPTHMTGVKRYTTIDKVELPRVEYSYHSPVGLGPGDAEMDLAGDVLASGKSSRLYKRLVIDDKIASEVDGRAGRDTRSAACSRSPSMPTPERDLDVVREGDGRGDRQVREGRADKRRTGALQGGGRALVPPGPPEPSAQGGQDQRVRILLGRAQRLQAGPGSVPQGDAREREGMVRQDAHAGARVVIRVLPEEPVREASARDKRADGHGGQVLRAHGAGDVPLKNGMKVSVWPRPDCRWCRCAWWCSRGARWIRWRKPGLAAVASMMLSEGAGGQGRHRLQRRVADDRGLLRRRRRS